MATFELSNPSDPYTLVSEDETVACMAALLLGNGMYVLRDEEDRAVLPLLFGGALDAWLAARVGDLTVYLDREAGRIADVLDSVTVGSRAERSALFERLERLPAEERAFARREWHDKRRQSLTDIGSYAWQLAAQLREAHRAKAAQAHALGSAP